MPAAHIQTAASRRSIILMDEDLQKRLVTLAEASRQTPEALAEHAVREFVKRRECADQLSLVALEEWQAFEASGPYWRGVLR